MKKLSKSDQPQTPEAAQAERDWHNDRQESQHFAIGTYVLFDNGRYRVEEYIGPNVIVINERDGSAWVIKNPYFMQWRL